MEAIFGVWLPSIGYYNAKNFVGTPYVPGEYANNLIDLANANPERQIYLWIDFAHLRPKEMAFMVELNKKTPRNLIFKNLRAIEKYNNEELLHKPETEIWKKVNYSRLIAAEHLLKNPRIEAAFYGDLDIKAKNYSSPGIQKRMKTNGCIFCWTRFGHSAPLFENSFFGFDKKHINILTEFFIPETETAMKSHANRREWGAFRNCIRSLFYKSGFDPEKKAQKFGIRRQTIWGRGNKECKVSFQKNCPIKGMSPPAPGR